MMPPPIEKRSIPLKQFGQLGLQIGVLTKVEAIPQPNKPFYKVTVGFRHNELSSVAFLKQGYPDIERLFNKHVVAVTNLPRREVAGLNSTCHIVTFPDERGYPCLLNTRGRQAVPGPLELNYRAPPEIPVEIWESVDIRAGLLREIEPMENEPNSYTGTVYLGPLEERAVDFFNIDEQISQELLGTQVAVATNILAGRIGNLSTYALTFVSEEGKSVPLGIDRVVPNGTTLL